LDGRPHNDRMTPRFFPLPNGERGSICQVGVACVKLDDSIETWATLVDPRTTHWFFTSLHGIDARMVRRAPSIVEVLDALEPVLESCTVYQHSGFDRSAIRAACGALGRDEPAWEWRDSVAVARHAWPELKGNGGHGLASLKKHLGPQFEHHDAGEDARAAAQVVLLAENTIAATGNRKLAMKEKAVPAPIVPTIVAAPLADLAGTVIARTQLTQANLKHHHFYLRKFLDAFPEMAIDASKKVNSSAGMLTVEWGRGVSSKTDICGRHKFFRDRANTRAFFERTCARPGDIIEVERIAQGRYRVALRRG
jgi:DNA polymerase-3 subunit epsilon